VPKVIDFGIAKSTQQRLTEKTLFTQFQQFIGTPAYMSPEQASLSGLDIDTRSDIYALGVLLYELLTGQTPFDTKALLSAGYNEILRVIREVEPPKPSTRLSTMQDEEQTRVASQRRADPKKLGLIIRGDLDWIVMKALEKDRAHRYETANGFASDIKHFLNDEPVTAVAPSMGYRFRKMVRRNRVAFAGAAAVAAALFLGIIGMTALYFRSEQLRKQAQHNLYVSNMNQAQLAWAQNNVGLVRQILEETTDYPDRGFEWYYWQKQTHLELMTLRGHFLVNAVAISPDGQRIVTAGTGNTAQEIAKGDTAIIWDAASGKKLVMLKEQRSIISAAMSPDGHSLATAGFNSSAPRPPLGTIRIWDVASARELLSFTSDRGMTFSVAFSPDSRRIVSAGVNFFCGSIN